MWIIEAMMKFIEFAKFDYIEMMISIFTREESLDGPRPPKELVMTLPTLPKEQQ
jgi:hypothetical protein